MANFVLYLHIKKEKKILNFFDFFSYGNSSDIRHLLIFICSISDEQTYILFIIHYRVNNLKNQRKIRKFEKFFDLKNRT